MTGFTYINGQAVIAEGYNSIIEMGFGETLKPGTPQEILNKIATLQATTDPHAEVNPLKQVAWGTLESLREDLAVLA